MAHQNEAAAREWAKKERSAQQVMVIESQGKFYVEHDGSFLRNWERECYSGLGKNAVPKKGYFTCKRCDTFNPSPAVTCKRCGLSADAGVPSGVGL